MKCVCGAHVKDSKSLAEHILGDVEKHKPGAVVWARAYLNRKPRIKSGKSLTKANFYEEMLEKERKAGTSPSL